MGVRERTCRAAPERPSRARGGLAGKPLGVFSMPRSLCVSARASEPYRDLCARRYIYVSGAREVYILELLAWGLGVLVAGLRKARLPRCRLCVPSP